MIAFSYFSCNYFLISYMNEWRQERTVIFLMEKMHIHIRSAFLLPLSFDLLGFTHDFFFITELWKCTVNLYSYVNKLEFFSWNDCKTSALFTRPHGKRFHELATATDNNRLRRCHQGFTALELTHKTLITRQTWLLHEYVN